MAVSNIKALIPGELQKVWDLVLDKIGRAHV